MHELDPPRKYKTIFVCGGFGLGSDRARDVAAVGRFYEHLEPGGTLVLDNEVPYADAGLWPRWTKAERDALPRAWGSNIDRRRASDGTDLGLQSRVLELDPLEQRVTIEIRARQWDGDELVAEEEHTLNMGLYFKYELLQLLERAGFVDVVVHGDHNEQEATADSVFLVFVAQKPASVA